MVGVVLVGAGTGKRLGYKKPKAFVQVAGRQLLTYVLETFSSVPSIREIVLVVPPPYLKIRERILSRWPCVREVVGGGQERYHSVWQGLKNLSPRCDIVLIHDVARPMAGKKLIEQVIRTTREKGACVPAVPVTDTIKRIQHNIVRATIPREGLVAVQTPQGFRRQLLETAFSRAKKTGVYGSDDSFLVEQLGFPVQVISGDLTNIKVTTAHELALVRFFLRRYRTAEKKRQKEKKCRKNTA